MSPFWSCEQLAKGGNNVALIDGKMSVTSISSEYSPYCLTYFQLSALIEKKKAALDFLKNKSLVMIVAHNSFDTVAMYLACLQLKHVVWFVDKELSIDKRTKLQHDYQVNLFINDSDIFSLADSGNSLHEDLALVITTSGSTGTPDVVKLSYDNLQHNCLSICQVLPLTASDKVMTTLPLQYSFGLSILNTHLNMGATIILNDFSVVQREFWEVSSQHHVSAFYGVPSLYQMLIKLKLARFPLQSYRYFAVAGGKLAEEHVKAVLQYCDENNQMLYVMYGQTEATARISYLPPEKVANKLNSIGRAIPNGKLWLEDNEGGCILAANVTGQLCYQGPNVMMGLSTCLEDLAKEKETEQLKTGDLAYFDNDGDFFIVGRIKRFLKINGQRINLDEIEQLIHMLGFSNACIGRDDELRCYLSDVDITDKELTDLSVAVCQQLNIHSRFLQLQLLTSIPTLPSGKTDYRTLESL